MSKLNGLYYLNNTGSRWVVFENGKHSVITLQTDKGESITRSVNYYCMFGNFATANISWKGKRIDVFNDTILR